MEVLLAKYADPPAGAVQVNGKWVSGKQARIVSKVNVQDKAVAGGEEEEEEESEESEEEDDEEDEFGLNFGI